MNAPKFSIWQNSTKRMVKLSQELHEVKDYHAQVP